MAMPKKNMKVLNRRTLLTGTVVKIDDEMIYIDVDSVGVKCVTHSNFERWWVEDRPEEEIKEAKKEVDAIVKETEIEDTTHRDRGESTGKELMDIFSSIIRSYNDKNLVIQYTKSVDAKVLYKGKAVFYVRINRRKLVVLAHPDSLTADNRRRMDKLYPAEWNKVLRARFVFQSPSQSPIMRSIISDGIFYRKNS